MLTGRQVWRSLGWYSSLADEFVVLFCYINWRADQKYYQRKVFQCCLIHQNSCQPNMLDGWVSFKLHLHLMFQLLLPECAS
jgi:hypothetical protein